EASVFAHPVAAGRELLRRLAEQERRADSFAIETTLSSTMYVRHMRAWRSATTFLKRMFGGAFIADWLCSSRSTRLSWTSGIIGTATKGDSVLASTRIGRASC